MKLAPGRQSFCAVFIDITSKEVRNFPFTHSARKDSTGLAIAAFIAWKLTVNKAINNAINPATKNTHQWILILYANPCNHLCIPQYAIGEAMTRAIKTNLIKSLDSKAVILETDAPSTFRTPISLVLCNVL